MQDFPPNSRKAKERSGPPPQTPEDRPKIERVTSATAVQRKRGLGRRVKDTFISGSAKDTANHMFADIIIPEIQDMFLEAFQSGLERLIKGESPSRNGRSPASSGYPGAVGPRVNYQAMSRPQSQQTTATRMLSRRSRSTHDFGELIIETHREARDVIEQMYEILDRLGSVSVADLYVMTDIESSHVDMRWGWTSLKGTRAVRNRDGRYLLDLPEPIPLD